MGAFLKDGAALAALILFVAACIVWVDFLLNVKG